MNFVRHIFNIWPRKGASTEICYILKIRTKREFAKILISKKRITDCEKINAERLRMSIPRVRERELNVFICFIKTRIAPKPRILDLFLSVIFWSKVNPSILRRSRGDRAFRNIRGNVRYRSALTPTVSRSDVFPKLFYPVSPKQ